MLKRSLSVFIVVAILFGIVVITPTTVGCAASNSVSVGDTITLGTYYDEPIVWRCVAIDENGPLMLSDKILCYKAFDSKGEDEFYHSDGWGYIRKTYGSNCWADSNIRQWLNSDEEQIAWTHCPPNADNLKYGKNAYDDEKGFICNFSSSDLQCIKTVTNLVNVNEWEPLRNGYCDGGNTEISGDDILNYSVSTDFSSFYYQLVTDKIFLLTAKQIAEINNQYSESLFSAMPTQSAINKNEDSSISDMNAYWLAVPATNGASYENLRTLNTWHAAYENLGIRPAFYLDANIWSGNITDKLRFNNSFITGYVNDTNSTLFILDSFEFSIGDISFESSDKSIVDITTVSIGEGNYITQGNEQIATVYLNCKKVGTATITATAPDGSTATLNVIVQNPTYEVKLYSLIPSLYVGQGDSLGAAVQLEKNGAAEDNAIFSIVSSNRNILTVDNISYDDGITYFSINGINEGQANITVTELNTNLVNTATVTVGSGVITYNANSIPTKTSNAGTIFAVNYNEYINGIYIDNFTSKLNQEGTKYEVTFDAYNSSDVIGTVDVYDANGRIESTTPLDRHTTLLTSLKETAISGYYLLKDTFTGNAFTYKEASYSKYTPVSVEVPLGGHIEISNDLNYSNTCAVANSAAFITDMVLMLDNAMELKPDKKEEVAEAVGENAVKKFLSAYGGAIKGETKAKKFLSLTSKFTDKFGKKTLEKLFKNNLENDIAQFVEESKAVFEDNKIDVIKLIGDTALSCGISVGESTLIKAMGPFGEALKGIFSVSSAINEVFFLSSMCKSYNTHTLNIYFNGKNGMLCDNGTTVSGTKNPQGLSDYVMHSVVITNDDTLDDTAITNLNAKSNRYSVWNIYLERDGKVSQPGQTVEVTLPIPTDYNKNGCKLYWVKDDGTLVLVETELRGNTLAFYTDHFSYYAIVDESTNILGDVDGDGKVDVFDASAIQKSLAGTEGYAKYDTLDQKDIAFRVADIDSNGTVDVFDAAAIQKWIAGDTSVKDYGIGEPLK